MANEPHVRELELSRLILTSFGVDELRGFIRHYYGAVVYSLPSSGSAEHIVGATIVVLEQRSLIDAAFFRRLGHARPHGHAEILSCARSWGIAEEELPAATPNIDAPVFVPDGQLQTNAVLGGYRLESQIAVGGYGSVWRCVAANGEVVALKILRPDLGHDRLSRDRFFRGAERMRSVEHPLIVRVLELHGSDRGHFFYAMQYIHGETFYRLCKSGKIPVSGVLPMIARVADALSAAHEHGLIHRDIKPQNIVVDRLGMPHITDFDFVSIADAPVQTHTGPTGTFGYTAPEVMRGEAADARADIFSLAATALFGLHRRDVIPSDINDGFIQNLGCSQAFKQVLSRATALEVNRRYATMRELQSALEREIQSEEDERERRRIAAINEAQRVAAPKPEVVAPAPVETARREPTSAVQAPRRMWHEGHYSLPSRSELGVKDILWQIVGLLFFGYLFYESIATDRVYRFAGLEMPWYVMTGMTFPILAAVVYFIVVVIILDRG